MQLGIIGLPQAGKTTIFNALTRGSIPTHASSGKIEVHTGVVDVPDPRVDAMVDIFQPKKIINTKVTYADIAGLDGSSGKSGISGVLLNHLAQMDGYIHVVRQFEDDSVAHVAETINPARDVVTMETEFILNDMVAVERKLERLMEEHRRGGLGRDKTLIAREIALFEKLNAVLSEEKPLRCLELDADEEKLLASYGFLSRKPQLIVVNQGEGQKTAPPIDLPFPHTQLVCLSGKLEMDIAQLPPDDMALFLEEYGIEEPSLNRLIRISYDLLGLQTFFTCGEKEVHAWTVRRGATAKEAAGVIHSDLEKGFIRAEIISYDDMVALRSLSEARNKGKLRVEGKDYIMQDGDSINVRFNI